MPAYNAAAFLGESISSVLGQTLSEYELLVVDDGSIDSTAEIARAHKDARIKVIQQHNQGQSAAINRGVQESRGRFIKIVDADDWINPDHLHAQLTSLEGTTDCVSACRWGYFREQCDGPDVRFEHTDNDYDAPMEWIVDSLTRDEGMMGGWRWLIPRSVWDRAGGYDARLSLNNDFHASIAILLASKGVRFAPEAVYSYRKGYTGSLSRGRSRRAMESALLTTELGCRLLLEHENSPRIRAICAKRFQRWAYDFFPDFPDLTHRAVAAAQALGGASLPFPGGKIAKLLSELIGWQNVRRLQSWALTLGWGHVQRLKQNRRIRRLP
jgi:glycosyltransferase involved in cell wall biosynthesis